MEDLLGRPVSEVLSRFSLDFDQLTMNDEPPGKLRGFSFLDATCSPPRKIWVAIEYSSQLFSITGRWPQELVLAAIVTYVSDKGWR